VNAAKDLNVHSRQGSDVGMSSESEEELVKSFEGDGVEVLRSEFLLSVMTSENTNFQCALNFID